MSQENGRIESPVLKTAWQRYAEFDANALSAAKQGIYVRQLALIVAMLTVLLAVFLQAISVMVISVKFSISP